MAQELDGAQTEGALLRVDDETVSLKKRKNAHKWRRCSAALALATRMSSR
jgi:hypothetical protein